MDLLSTLRKPATSRGGAPSASSPDLWDSISTSQHRENYLGHSLKAPVGRWQKGKDLSWYAKGDVEAEAAEQERRGAERARIKAQEDEAMRAALGLGPRAVDENPNLSVLGGGAGGKGRVGREEVTRVVKEGNEGMEGEDGVEGVGMERGVGFGAFAGGRGAKEGEEREMLFADEQVGGGVIGRARQEDEGKRSKREEDEGEREERRRRRRKEKERERRDRTESPRYREEQSRGYRRRRRSPEKRRSRSPDRRRSRSPARRERHDGYGRHERTDERRDEREYRRERERYRDDDRRRRH